MSTSKYSRSIRPTSRLPKTPVQSAQCTFFSVESLRYFDATIRDPRNTLSNAHCSNPMWRCGFALSMYTRAASSVGVVTSALVKTLVTKVMNFVCSGRRVAVFPLGRVDLRPMAKSTVSTTESTTYSITSLETSSSNSSTRA